MSPGVNEAVRIYIAQRRKIYSGPVSLVRRANLYELRVPKAASYYEEHVFHDNAEDAAWFHANLRPLAESTARGLCDYFAIPFTDPYAQEDEEAEEKAEERAEEKVEEKAEQAATMAAVELPVLRRGDTSAAVRAAMVVLKDGGFYSLPLGCGDKTFGPEMEAAVRRLQASRGLTVDGIAGRETWPALLGV